jgi:DNA-binding MarR family transcriptional regulator
MEPTFGYLVSNIARLMRKNFDQRARQVGVSLVQGRAMVYLARHEGINQTGLADLLEVKPISLARLLDRMAVAGWIERRADPDDRRAHRLYLSEKARPLLESVQDLAADTRAEALAGLSNSEETALIELLMRVHRNLLNREPTGNEASEPAVDMQDVHDECIQ